MNNHLYPAADALYADLASAAKSLLKGAVNGGYLSEEFAMRRDRIAGLVDQIAHRQPMTAAEKSRLLRAALPKSVNKGSLTRRANLRAERNMAFQQRVMAEGWPKKRKQRWQKILLDILMPGVMHNGGRRAYGDHLEHCAVTYERHMTAAENFYAGLNRGKVVNKKTARREWLPAFGAHGCDNSDGVERRAKEYKSKIAASVDPATKRWATLMMETGLEMVKEWIDGVEKDAEVQRLRKLGDPQSPYSVDGMSRAVLTAGYAAIGKTTKRYPRVWWPEDHAE